MTLRALLPAEKSGASAGSMRQAEADRFGLFVFAGIEKQDLQFYPKSV